MHLVHQIKDIPHLSTPLALSIGSFDGMHLGHQFLLHKMRELAGPQGHIAIVTFSNHPSLVIKTKTQSCLLCSQEHKLALLRKSHVDLVILLPFTQETANLSYEEFLSKIRERYPFSFLVLGEGAAFGKGLEGHEQNVKELSHKLHFTPYYLKKQTHDGHVVSSGRIRFLVQKGDLNGASELLGRPYSLYGVLQKVPHNRMVMHLNGICLPPEGTYEVKVDQKSVHAILSHSPSKLEIEASLKEDPYEVVF